MPLYQILVGDCIDRLREVPDRSIRMCVTSPPYWGLRDYGVVGQIGLEATPDAFVARLVDVFRQVRRVLVDDGSLWLNLGDSYAGSWGAQGRQGKTGELAGRSAMAARQIAASHRKGTGTGARGREMGLKSKDLVGVPWMVAFALRADGWYLRADVIWHKPNPMPESVKDRPTRAHEYLFLLTKSKRYYYDAAAIATELRPKTFTAHGCVANKSKGNDARGRVKSDNWGRRVGARAPRLKPDGSLYGANKRTVWTVGARPSGIKHFATFPPKLIEPCVLASSVSGDVVLDPFAGVGTTGLVALRLGRDFLGIELNPEYAGMAEARIDADCVARGAA